MDLMQDLCSGEVQMHDQLGTSELTEEGRHEWEQVSHHLGAELPGPLSLLLFENGLWIPFVFSFKFRRVALAG